MSSVTKMRRKPRGVPAWLNARLHRIERERRAAAIARPMREMFAMLATGEVFEADGQAVMLMPEISNGEMKERAQWRSIAPAMNGWADCWQRLAPDIPVQYIRYLAQRLADDKPLTPRLVEQARDQFEETIHRLVDLPDSEIRDGLLTTRIAWELERKEARGERG